MANLFLLREGYYRVTYDQENYKMIADQLVSDHSKIALLNRAQLLDDAFTLANIDRISYSTAFDLTLYLKNEIEYVPWRSVLDELDYIDIMLHRPQENYDWQVLTIEHNRVYNTKSSIFIFYTEVHDKPGPTILHCCRFYGN